MAARTGNPILDVLLLVGGYYVFTHPSTGLDAEAALAYQEGVLIPSRKSKDIAKLQQLLKTAQATGQTAAATTIQAYLTKLQGGTAGSPSKTPGKSPSRTPTTYTPAALGSCTHTTLRVGSSGPCVAALQERLDTLMNAGLPHGGHFEGNLEAAVKAFQRQEGITVDGIVGPQTWARLVSPHRTVGIPRAIQPTPSPHPTAHGRPTGRYGVPTSTPSTLPTGANGLPAGYTLYVADTYTGKTNLGLSREHAAVRLAVWDPPQILLNLPNPDTMLGLGRAYYPAVTPHGPAKLSPYWGVAEYVEQNGTWRRKEVYAQAASAGANDTVSHTTYALEGIGPRGASF